MGERIGVWEQLIDARRANPFIPFHIIMNDGVRHKVMDRLSMAMNREKLVILPRRGTSIWLRLKNIESVKVPRPKGNG
jgi:hypothetical protein